MTAVRSSSLRHDRRSQTADQVRGWQFTREVWLLPDEDSPVCGGLRHHSFLEGVAHQLGVGLEVEFVEKTRSICADSLHAQGQVLSDLRHAHSRRKQIQ